MTHPRQLPRSLFRPRPGVNRRGRWPCQCRPGRRAWSWCSMSGRWPSRSKASPWCQSPWPVAVPVPPWSKGVELVLDVGPVAVQVKGLELVRIAVASGRAGGRPGRRPCRSAVAGVVGASGLLRIGAPGQAVVAEASTGEGCAPASREAASSQAARCRGRWPSRSKAWSWCGSPWPVAAPVAVQVEGLAGRQSLAWWEYRVGCACDCWLTIPVYPFSSRLILSKQGSQAR